MAMSTLAQRKKYTKEELTYEIGDMEWASKHLLIPASNGTFVCRACTCSMSDLENANVHLDKCHSHRTYDPSNVCGICAKVVAPRFSRDAMAEHCQDRSHIRAVIRVKKHCLCLTCGASIPAVGKARHPAHHVVLFGLHPLNDEALKHELDVTKAYARITTTRSKEEFAMDEFSQAYAKTFTPRKSARRGRRINATPQVLGEIMTGKAFTHGNYVPDKGWLITNPLCETHFEDIRRHDKDMYVITPIGIDLCHECGLIDHKSGEMAFTFAKHTIPTVVIPYSEPPMQLSDDEFQSCDEDYPIGSPITADEERQSKSGSVAKEQEEEEKYEECNFSFEDQKLDLPAFTKLLSNEQKKC